MKRYIQENQDRFFEELFSLLRIPSVSAQEARKPDMLRCAERLKVLLEAGADEADVYPVRGHNPVVFAKKMVNPEWKTVLVYGHYDVQPAEPLEKWASDPFAPEIRKDPSGRDAIYARGANDDKGQLFMHLKAFEYLVRSGKLHHNLKFVFEGEEEIGSPSLAGWVRKHKDWLGADVILVSDTTMISEKVPSINCGMRGLAYLEVNLIGPDKDLHSGHYGGAVANPIQTLCDLISGLIDADGRVTVPGFYDDVVELSIEDRAQLAGLRSICKHFKTRSAFARYAAKRLLDPGAHRHPTLSGCMRHLGRLYGRGRQDGPALVRPCEDFHAAGPGPGEREDHETVQGVSGTDRAGLLQH